MIQLIENAAERSTASTDMILAVEFLLFAVLFIKAAPGNLRAAAWSCPFLLLAGAFLIGAIAHGFQMPAKTNELLWHFIAAASAFGLANLVSASVGEWRPAWYKQSVIGVSFAAVAFIGITVEFSAFAVYVGFTLIAMAIVSWLNAIGFKNSGNRNYLMIILGAVLTAIASLVQLIEGIHFTLIWEFDHNGAFHLVQILAGIFLGFGISGLMKSSALSRGETLRENDQHPGSGTSY